MKIQLKAKEQLFLQPSAENRFFGSIIGISATLEYDAPPKSGRGSKMKQLFASNILVQLANS